MIKIYGIDARLNPIKAQLSDVVDIHVAWRWWWPGAGGKVCPLPDRKRSLLWFEPRATGRWRAVFLCQLPNEKERQAHTQVRIYPWLDI